MGRDFKRYIVTSELVHHDSEEVFGRETEIVYCSGPEQFEEWFDKRVEGAEEVRNARYVIVFFTELK